MRSDKICALSALLLVGQAFPSCAEMFSVVRLTDLRGNAAFQVCTEEEKRKIEGEMRAEAQAFPKVVEKVKADWALSQADAAFPSSRINVRTLKVMGTAIDREEAGKLLAQAKIREERSLADEKKDEEAALNARPGRRGRAHREAVADQKEQILEDQKRDNVADRAEGMVRTKLSAAVGHGIPFYGTTDDEPKKKAGRKKNK